MLVTLSGIVTLVRLVQPQNAPSMLVTLSGIVMLVRLLQPANWVLDECGLALVQQRPIEAAVNRVECVHVDLVRLLQFLNAPPSMLMTLLPIVTLVRPVQPPNA
jgi:hypothetical protein